MSKKANFQVHPKLAELLGETYRSTEDAIKELVDNAFDADASNIRIELPDPLEPDPIIKIIDDGTGMKELEVRSEYLKIASSRYSRKGSHTASKKRKVKGRKGIGKFSGLMVADVMEVITCAGAKKTTLVIAKSQLAEGKYDLEKIDLPINVIACSKEEHGTTIVLKGLNQNFVFPNPDKLKQLLVWDYGRVDDLSIKVNNELITIEDYQGKSFKKELFLNDGKKATLTYTISDKTVKQSGIAIRVGGKIIGKPLNFLKEDEIIPDKLKSRVVGELSCDDLEDFVTADHGAIIDNSKLFQDVKTKVVGDLDRELNSVFKTDMHLARQRYKQKIDRELQKLPEYKRSFAEKSIQKILEKFYGESEEKVGTIISVMISALEKDHYWNIIQDIERSREKDVQAFADALCEFGMLEMSLIAQQVINRLKFLDQLDILQSNPNTTEDIMHKALSHNLWILGTKYTLVLTNSTLSTACQSLKGKKYEGDDGAKRPDLFLGQRPMEGYLLIEFKRPSFTIGRDTESQALKYRDSLNSIINNEQIEIVLIGGKVDSKISSHNQRGDVKFLTYTEVISTARNQLKWLLEELKRNQ